MIIDDMLNIKDIVFMFVIYKHEKRWYDDMSNINKDTVGSLQPRMLIIDHLPNIKDTVFICVR